VEASFWAVGGVEGRNSPGFLAGMTQLNSVLQPETFVLRIEIFRL
jgi:hypothetical protein